MGESRFLVFMIMTFGLRLLGIKSPIYEKPVCQKQQDSWYDYHPYEDLVVQVFSDKQSLVLIPELSQRQLHF